MATVRYSRIFIAGVCLMTLACVNVSAQDVQFTAEVDQNKIVLGASAQLTLTVTGTQDVTGIPAPSADGLDIRYLGPSTQISIVNGQYSSRKSWIYSVMPLKTGHFTIPSVSINANGSSRASDPVEIEVTDTPANPGVAPVPSSPSSAETDTSLTDKVFLVLRLSKDKVYVNERLPIKILLFVAGLSVADVHFPEFKQAGVDMDKFDQPQQYDQMVNGIRYHTVEFNTNIYPTRIGELTIGPVTLDCNLAARSASARTPFGAGMFDDDFFNTFFDRYEKRPLALRSKTSGLTVLPLPEENKPADFAGAVGQFNLDASVGPAEVNVGDPVTVRMQIGGEGNLKMVQPPAFTGADNFKVYDPQIKEEMGVKKLEQVLIPESEHVTGIPAVQFSYFDPTLQRYQTLTKGPFPITVRRPKSDAGLKVVGSAAAGGAPASEPPVLGHDIVFIKESPGTFYVIGERFYRTLPFYLAVALFLGAWTVLWIAYRRTRKMTTDVAYARRLLAPKEARRDLREAKRLEGSQDTGKFYDALFRTLQKYLGNKLHLSAGAVTFETIRSRLSGRVDEKWLEEIRQAFDECDAIRYAPARPSAGSCAESYARVQRIIDALERSIS
ncbi:MAG: protein BatD [Candidatus Omnitrophica bacterium]|nr:protein BatD [Candidatus Omnitrophota bacterium]